MKLYKRDKFAERIWKANIENNLQSIIKSYSIITDDMKNFYYVRLFLTPISPLDIAIYKFEIINMEAYLGIINTCFKIKEEITKNNKLEIRGSYLHPFNDFINLDFNLVPYINHNNRTNLLNIIESDYVNHYYKGVKNKNHNKHGVWVKYDEDRLTYSLF